MNATTVFIAAYLAAFLFAVLAAAWQVSVTENEISRQKHDFDASQQP